MTSQSLLCGVDMVHLHTRDFKVKDSRELFLDKSTFPNQNIEELPVPFYDDKGAVYCRKAQVQNRKNQIPYFISIDRRGLSLQFNPSKARHAYNLNSDIYDIDLFSRQIAKDCQSIGLSFDLDNSKLNRIDLAKQDFTDRSINNYRSVFDFIQGKRMKQRGYENGYLVYNGESEACFYDKGIEQKNPLLVDFLRVESRFKTDKSIIKNLGINRYSDFLKTDCYVWNESYNDYLNKTIFDKYDDKLILNFDSEVAKLKFLKQGQGAVYKHRNLRGMISIIEMYGSMDFYYEVMAAAGFSTDGINKQKVKDIELLKLESKGSMISVSQLINELKQKFAA